MPVFCCHYVLTVEKHMIKFYHCCVLTIGQNTHIKNFVMFCHCYVSTIEKHTNNILWPKTYTLKIYMHDKMFAMFWQFNFSESLHGNYLTSDSWKTHTIKCFLCFDIQTIQTWYNFVVAVFWQLKYTHVKTLYFENFSTMQ